MGNCAIFINAVLATDDDLPETVRASAHRVRGLEVSRFDQSYLEFLDEQIDLNARGNEWTRRFRARRIGLSQWCDHSLLFGRIPVGTDEYTVYVDPQSTSIVYWEHDTDVCE